MQKTHRNGTKNFEVDYCTINEEIILKRASLGGSESLNRILHGGYVSEYPFSLYKGRELAHISVQVIQLSIGIVLSGCRAFFGGLFRFLLIVYLRRIQLTCLYEDIIHEFFSRSAVVRSSVLESFLPIVEIPFRG